MVVLVCGLFGLVAIYCLINSVGLTLFLCVLLVILIIGGLFVCVWCFFLLVCVDVLLCGLVMIC